MTAISHLGFQKFEILTATGVFKGLVRITMPAVTIGQTVAKMWQFFNFQNGRLSSWKIGNFNGQWVLKGQSVHVTLPNCVAVGQIIAKIWQLMVFQFSFDF